MMTEKTLEPEEKVDEVEEILETPAAEHVEVEDESNVDASTDHATESVDAMIGGVDDLSVLTISEAKFDLAKGELEVTFIQPGLNRSGHRFYPKETIQEGITKGIFDNLKMYLNHATPQDLVQRPERSLTEWVSTIKETWVDPSTGSGKARVKVVQNWFKSFLKDLQEADALGEIGLSIFAQGRVKAGKINGKMTNVVEEFSRAMSVDWVTEPGAGGRIDSIWESHQPIMIKEQELNVLNSMKTEEAVQTIREGRPDILEALKAELKSTDEADARLQEAVDHVNGLAEQITKLEADLATAKAETATAETDRVKAEYAAHILESMKDSTLPKTAQDRVTSHMEMKLTPEGALDLAAITESLAASVKAEEEYMAEILKDTKPAGAGITGLGESGNAGNSDDVVDPQAKVKADIAKRFGHVEPKTEPKA